MNKNSFKKTILSNGINIITAEMLNMESVAVGVMAGVGGRYENDDNAGISHFLEHACFKGTKKRSARQISQAIEGIGGNMNGFTSEEITCYYAKVRYLEFNNALDVLLDMYRNSVFNPPDIERERSVIKEEIKMYLDMPSQLVYEDFEATIWKNHPLSRSVLGTSDSVDKITRAQLKNFTKQYYSPGNTVISVAGNVNHDNVVKTVREKLAKWHSITNIPAFLPYKSTQKKTRVCFREKPTEQAHMVIGFRSFGRTHPDRFALKLLSTILGENMSSRLNHEIREKRGLAYSVHSHVSKYADTGALQISVDTDLNNMTKTLKLIFKICNDIVSKGIKPIELAHAKKYTNGTMALTLENTTSNMIWLGRNVLTGEDIMTIDEIVGKYNEVDIDDIQRVAGNIFKNNRLNAALVSTEVDKNKIRDIVRL